MQQLSFLKPIEISLTKGYVALIDPCDMDLLGHKWCVTGHHRFPRTPYARRALPRDLSNGKQRSELLHRVILERVINRRLLSNEQVDHIDGNGLNNCRSNLRLASNAENSRNRKIHADNHSGYKGVTWNKNIQKWAATIGVDYKRIHLGYFDDPELAHRVYLEASSKYHGQFAREK